MEEREEKGTEEELKEEEKHDGGREGGRKRGSVIDTQWSRQYGDIQGSEKKGKRSLIHKRKRKTIKE